MIEIILMSMLGISIFLMIWTLRSVNIFFQKADEVDEKINKLNEKNDVLYKKNITLEKSVNTIEDRLRYLTFETILEKNIKYKNAILAIKSYKFNELNKQIALLESNERPMTFQELESLLEFVKKINNSFTFEQVSFLMKNKMFKLGFHRECEDWTGHYIIDAKNSEYGIYRLDADLKNWSHDFKFFIEYFDKMLNDEIDKKNKKRLVKILEKGELTDKKNKKDLIKILKKQLYETSEGE